MSRRVRSRRDAADRRKRTRLALVGAVTLAALGVVALAFGIVQATRTQASPAPGAEASAGSSPSAPSTAGASATVASSKVEVPSVIGLSVEEARMILEAAGFDVSLGGSKKDAADSSKVTTQTPEPGTLAARAAVVTLSATSGAGAVASVLPNQSPTGAGLVVVIDPGHQQHSDPKPEPIGPGATKTKAGVTGGTTGIKTRLPEYEVVLQISMNLKARLEAAGVKVVMTRTTNDVRLTNSERAKVANKANADLFVRVHADGSPEGKTSGISTLYPGKNEWTKPIIAESKAAAGIVQSSIVAASGAVDQGIKSRTDLTGFNYAKVPAILVETGFMSNQVEDKLLSSPHYQDKLAQGMADGILAYLSGSAQ